MMTKRIHLLGLLIAVGQMAVAELMASDWPRFRGPNGSGVSPDTESMPTTFSKSENLKWKVALPGPGSSCPIVIGQKVFVTCWTGYGVERGDPGDQSQLRRHLICLNRADGKTLWSAAVEPYLPEDRYGGMFAEHGYASHTPVSDGERVYAYFGKTGAVAFDMNGKQLWKTQIGKESDPRDWGSASSPVLFQNLVIVTASAESEAIVALDKQTGTIVWRQEAAGLNGTWGTPILVPVGNDRTDLVLGVPNEVWGLNPLTGKLRWFCEAMETNSFCSSVISDGSIIYGMESRGGGSVAIRAGGEGDVSKTHVAWSGRDNNRIDTPIIHEGRIYYFSNRVANCIQAQSGERIYQSRLIDSSAVVPSREEPRGGRGGRGQDYASAVMGDNKIYFTARNGNIYVLRPGPQFEQLAVNRLTDEAEDFSATPAISNGELFIRSSKSLYCVGHLPAAR